MSFPYPYRTLCSRGHAHAVVRADRRNLEPLHRNLPEVDGLRFVVVLDADKTLIRPGTPYRFIVVLTKRNLISSRVEIGDFHTVEKDGRRLPAQLDIQRIPFSRCLLGRGTGRTHGIDSTGGVPVVATLFLVL